MRIQTCTCTCLSSPFINFGSGSVCKGVGRGGEHLTGAWAQITVLVPYGPVAGFSGLRRSSLCATAEPKVRSHRRMQKFQADVTQRSCGGRLVVCHPEPKVRLHKLIQSNSTAGMLMWGARETRCRSGRARRGEKDDQRREERNKCEERGEQ